MIHKQKVLVPTPKGTSIFSRIAMLGSFVGVALLYGMLVEGWTAIESIYWMVATVTTVGYGDLTPKSSKNGMVFGIFFIVIGIVVIFDIITEFILDKYEVMKRAAIRKSDRAAKAGRSVAFAEINLEPHESNCYPAWLRSALNVLPTRSAFRYILILVGGTAFFAYVEQWSYIQALYWCFCTSTTVGAVGDLKLTHESSRGFSIAYILISVISFGSLIGEFATKRTKLRMAKQRAAIRNLQLTPRMLRKMDQDKGGPVCVDPGEFMAYCLAELNIISTAESRLFIDKFREIDMDENGVLTLADLQLAANNGEGMYLRRKQIEDENHAIAVKKAKLQVESTMKKQMHQRESTMQQEKQQIEKQMEQMETKLQNMEEHMEQVGVGKGSRKVVM
jgi:hypothetical protein